MSEVIVVIRESADRADWLEALSQTGLNVTEMSHLPRIFIVHGTTAADFPLAGHPAVESVEDSRLGSFKPTSGTVTVETLPTSGPWPLLRHTHRDPPWPLAGLALPWSGPFDCARTGLGVDYYSIDGGVRASHQEFGSRVTALDSFTPIYYHGTACASCAVGSSLGLARESLLFSAAGLRNANGSGSDIDILNAVNACLAHYNGRSALNRPAVLSASFEGVSAGYTVALDNCVSAGIVVLGAAGNGRALLTAVNVYPAESLGAICVGGTNMGDGPYNVETNGTNYGLEVDILGGSQHVRMATVTGDTDYITASGTSFGTPYVGGVVACMLQGYRRLTTRAQVEQVGMYLYEQATFGRYRPDPRFEPMTPAIAYLDPGPGPYPPIPLLVPLA